MTVGRTASVVVGVMLLTSATWSMSVSSRSGEVSDGALAADATFVRADGARVTLRALADAVPQASLLLIRVQAGWCGTCRWHAGWTGDLRARVGRRVSVIDVLIVDDDNEPASAAAAASWQRRTGGAAVTVTDGEDRFGARFAAPAPLPRMLIVDRATLAVRATLANPDPDRLIDRLARELGKEAETRTGAAMVDGFSVDQAAMIREMRLVEAPRDPSNRVEDDPRAAALGKALFFDKGLSPLGRGCVSCHEPDLLFTNGKEVPTEGAGAGRRNVPTILLASHARSLLWDGRADSASSQAAMPFEDPAELSASRLYVAHGIRAMHRTEYEAIFGPLPPLELRERFPADAKPGDYEWERMRADDREAVTRVLANAAKAIAAFERSLRVAPNALDRYAAGDHAALTPAEKDGLAAFFAAGCAQCHYGPRLTDDAFHNLRFPTGRQDRQGDRGRIDGIPILLASEFSRSGPFSDARSSAPEAAGRSMVAALGAFRTPGLRGVSFTNPYGHGGSFSSLASVIDAHRTGGLPPDSRGAVGEAEPWPQGFDPQLVPRIERFLRVLRADVARD